MKKGEVFDFYRATLGEIEDAGVKKNERIITTPQSAHIFADGKELINMCANNYLGLADNPELVEAAKKAYEEQELYRAKVQSKGDEIIRKAEQEGKKIFVLAGRPYHIDPEINHGIDKLIAGFDVAIVSEDVISSRVDRFFTGVLNQWTYHSRLYAAAKYVTTREDMELVQLVSFGCGVDAITTDEVREILEKKNKIYTQIKIDEITNLGAVKIRIRSLLAAIDKD